MQKRVLTKIKDYVEPLADISMVEKLKVMSDNGKSPQIIKEKSYIYSTLDYPVKLTYTNGEELMIAPKSKEIVDSSLIDQSAIPKGLLLKLV